jgi:hypothetical protein
VIVLRLFNGTPKDGDLKCFYQMKWAKKKVKRKGEIGIISEK